MKLISKGKGRLNVNRKGDLAEYYAVTWLWDNGYEVFQNAGCTGPVDLIALDKNNNVLLIDVKCDSWSTQVQRKVFKSPRTKEQIAMGVQILRFNPDTRKLKFVEHRNEEET